MLQESASFNHPLAIRYPRAGAVEFLRNSNQKSVFEWETIGGEEDASLLVLAVGERCLTLAMKALETMQKKGKMFGVVNARCVKPLDESFLKNCKAKTIVTVEDNVSIGGFGSMVSAYFSTNMAICVKNFAYKDAFIEQGGISILQKEYGVNLDEIIEYIDGKI